MNNKKRSRSVNWTEEEKELFCSVLKEHVHVIENKTIDSKTNQAKHKAWEKIYKKFNELNGRPRQLMQLKIQWKKMKLKARKRWKTCSTFQKQSTSRTRPATPDDAVIENKYVSNPAELLREEDNLYNSDENDYDDYASSIVTHIKMLKEKEHRRGLQMAEEEHSIKIAIQEQKLKSATLEREILELKKMREQKIST